MYTGLVHAHSGLRWIVLLTLLWAVYQAYSNWKNNNAATKSNLRAGLISMSAFHLQFVLGLVLYFMSPRVLFTGEMMKNSAARFFTMEHLVMMVIALVLVTVGYRKGKGGGFKAMFWYYLIALIVILVAIPWPFRGFDTGWF